MIFFDLEIVLDSFCWVNFNLFYVLIKGFILRYSLIVLLFFSTFSNAVSVSLALVAPFFE